MAEKKPDKDEDIEKIIGRPLTQADERRHAQRKAGYEGWIDKKGNPTKGSGKW